MKKTYENSHLEWLTQKDIEANNESEFYMIVQVEVVDREGYEKITQKGKIKELEKKIYKLKEEKDDLSGRLDAAAEIASAEVRKRQKAEETIEEMKAGFRELERVFGDLPPEIVSLYRIPDRKG